MAKSTGKKKRPLRVVFRRSSLLTKCVVLVTLVVTTTVLLYLAYQIKLAQDSEAADRAEADRLKHSIAELEEKRQNKGSVEYYEELAKEELGRVDPSTIVFESSETTP